MVWVLRIALLISVLIAVPAAANTLPPERDRATWSLIDTSGKVVKADVGEFYMPARGPKPESEKVLVRNSTVDGHTVFQTLDANDHHVMATFPSDLSLSYTVDPSGLVLILRMEKNQYGSGHLVYGFAKVTGEIVVEPQYDEAGPFGPNGLAPVHKDRKVGFIDTDGKLRIPMQFLDAKAFGNNGLAPALTSAGWGYIDGTGTFIIAPHFVDAKPFNDKDFAPVSDSHWGYIDHTGTFVISPQFDDAWTFWADGTALVKFAGKEKTFIERHFGPWTLKAVITPAPDHPIMGPDPWAYVKVTGQSADRSMTWTFSTYGEGLHIESVMAPPHGSSWTTMPDFPATDAEFADVLNADVEAVFKRSPSAGEVYKKELAVYRADLLSALAAMRATSTDLWGKQSKPCLPPDCIY